MKKNKGFTLIELLVVVAIIGILSAVVVSAISYARNKAANNSIKSGLNEVRSQADIYYNINGTYKDVCSSTKDTTDPKGINDMVFKIGKNSGSTGSVKVNGTGASSTVRCNDAKEGWAAEVKLNDTTDYYCVDYTRKGIVTSTSIGDTRGYCH